jgi:hypothetical protein
MPLTNSHKMFLQVFNLPLKRVRKITAKKRWHWHLFLMMESEAFKTYFSEQETSYEITSICFWLIKAVISSLILNRNYLSPDLSISKMYGLYTQHCTEKNVVPRSEAFHTKPLYCNSVLHLRKKYTYSKCDKYEILLK